MFKNMCVNICHKQTGLKEYFECFFCVEILVCILCLGKIFLFDYSFHSMYVNFRKVYDLFFIINANLILFCVWTNLKLTTRYILKVKVNVVPVCNRYTVIYHKNLHKLNNAQFIWNQVMQLYATCECCEIKVSCLFSIRH